MKKSIIAAAAAAALVAAGSLSAVSLAQAETPTPTPSAPTTSAAPAPAPTTPGVVPSQHKHEHNGSGKGMGPGQMKFVNAASKEIATKLGVDEATLRTAGRNAADTLRQRYEAAGTRPGIDQLQKDFGAELARQLGLPEDKVQQAIADARAVHQAEADAAIKTRLDQAVAEGKLTQAEADAVSKAIKAGVVPGGFGHGHR